MICVSGCVWSIPNGTKNECYVSGYRCVSVSVSERVCVSLDKTVNPQATRTQYPVCPFLISCLTLAEREAAGRGWRGTTGPGRYLRNRRYSRLIGIDFPQISLSLPLWCNPLFSPSFPFSLCFYYLRFNKAEASSLFCHETFISCLL